MKLALGAERIGVVEQHHEEQALDRAQLLAILSDKLSQGPAAAVVRHHLAKPVIEVQEVPSPSAPRSGLTPAQG